MSIDKELGGKKIWRDTKYECVIRAEFQGMQGENFTYELPVAVSIICGNTVPNHDWPHLDCEWLS